MTIPNPIEQNATDDWLHIFEVLSLDRAVPFLADAGFKMIPSAVLRTICRDCIRQRYQSGVDEPKLVKVTLDRIEKECDPDTVKEVQRWASISHDNYRDEYDQMRDWVLLLGILSGYFSTRGFPSVPVNLPDEKIPDLKIGFLTFIADTYKSRLFVCETEKEKLSEWDEYVYGKYPHLCSPLTWLENQIAFMYRVSHWQQIEHLLTEEEFELLGEWGRKQAEALPEQRPPQLVRFRFSE
ncbi:MAG TPA: hypothetical protein VHO69_08455 [Phototrophicaceae bacterium]|nr:hypothetical protein [Phototrophicaceae bacterium]